MKIAGIGIIGLAAAFAVGVTGCNRAQDQGPDPASANMAPMGQGQTEPVAQNEPPVQNGAYEEQLSQAPAPPPPLPEYSQPSCPGENYMWTPGYWAYSTAGYYWTPGAWVMAPFTGALWTPPYWGYSNGVYIWNAGYWGPYVGFYGGIDYGYGYTGRGFYGGYWRGGVFNYNRSVMNVNTTVVRNVYERRVTNYTPANRISYNGGNGGVNLRPVASEAAAMRARRMGAAPTQVQYQREAAANRAQFASVNHGRPSIAAARPAAAPAAVQEERRVTEGETLRKEAPAANAKPEQRGGFEARGGAASGNERPAPYQPVQRGSEPRQNPGVGREAPVNGAPTPYSRPSVAGRPQAPEQRPTGAPAGGNPAPARNGFEPGRPAVASRPQMPEQRPTAAPAVANPARPGFQPGRPPVAARPQMPEQRPSPFRGPAARPSQAPQPQQQHSADRRVMAEPRPQPPAAKPAPPEGRPAAPQARPAQGHQEPQQHQQDRGKHDK